MTRAAMDPAGWHQRIAGCRRRMADDRGVAATVVLFPLFAVSVFAMVQGILWQNQRQVAVAAADAASAAVALYGASPDTAQAEALAQARSAGLREVSVSISRDARFTVVEVSGVAPGIIAGTSVTVTARSVTPSEGYRSP